MLGFWEIHVLWLKTNYKWVHEFGYNCACNLVLLENRKYVCLLPIYHLNQLCNPASKENKTQCGVFLHDLHPNWTFCFIFHLLTSISGNKTNTNPCSVLLEGHCRSEQGLNILIDCSSMAVSSAVTLILWFAKPGNEAFLFFVSCQQYLIFVEKRKRANSSISQFTVYMKCKSTWWVSQPGRETESVNFNNFAIWNITW